MGYMTTIRTCLRNKLLLSLFFFTFLTNFSCTGVILLIPIKSSFYLNWIQIDVATCGIVSAVIGSAICLILIGVLSKYINDIYFLIYSATALFLALMFMMLFPLVPGARAMSSFIPANRIDNVNGRMIFLTDSIITIIGIKKLGVPIGTKRQKRLINLKIIDKIILPYQKGK